MICPYPPEAPDDDGRQRLPHCGHFRRTATTAATLMAIEGRMKNGHRPIIRKPSGTSQTRHASRTSQAGPSRGLPR